MNVGVNRLIALLDPLGRIMIASLFLASAHTHLTHWHVTVAEMQSHGMANASFWLAAAVVVELGGSIGLALGYWPRVSALSLAAFCVIATSIFHHNFSQDRDLHMFIKDIALAGALLCLAVRGAGPYSLGNRARKTQR